MKILHITDSHGTVKSPEKRLDLYYYTFLRKLAEISYVSKLQKIDMIIHTGDLFHTSIVSMKFMGQVAELIKSMGIPFYVVPGNHDINGYTIDTIDQTSLGVLIKTGVVSVLDRDHPFVVKGKSPYGNYSVAVSGQEYYEGIDSGNQDDFEMQQTQKDLNVLCIHGYVTNKPQHPNIRHTLTKDIITDADIVLSGHWHQSFQDTIGDTDFYNPGSMLRVEATPYNQSFIPQYGILTVDLDNQGFLVTDYQFHKFKVAQPGSCIFDFTSIGQAKQTSVTLNNFKTSLVNTMASSGAFAKINQNDIIDQITKETFLDLAANNTMPPNVKESDIVTVINNDMKNATVAVQTSESLFTKGYVESKKKKKIKKVTIHNFMSHAHNEIDFVDGLNIIIGESNEGKTAILRAICWATNNDPTGSAFITTGENDCYVTIEYDDGSFVKRSRTIKDSGAYDIGFYDDNNVFQQMTLKGFGTEVPIEVQNVHQMPKISITNDIEKNLNIMTQLEAPFLLANSQAVKAEAIGKIANTDIIDEAIKKASASITSYKKNLKEKNDALKALNENKKNYSNVSLVKKLMDSLKKIQEEKAKKEKLIQDATSLLKNFVATKSKIDTSSQEIVKLQQVLSYQEDVEKAENVYDILNKITKIQQTEQFYRNGILSSEGICKTCTQILSSESNVLEAEALLVKIKSMLLYQNSYQTKKELMTMTKDKITTYTNAVDSHKEEIEQSEKLLASVKSMTELVNKINSVQSKIEDVSEKIKNQKLVCENKEKEYQQRKEEMKEYLLQSKLCPYCGQEISETCANQIIKQREESSNG